MKEVRIFVNFFFTLFPSSSLKLKNSQSTLQTQESTLILIEIKNTYESVTNVFFPCYDGPLFQKKKASKRQKRSIQQCAFPLTIIHDFYPAVMFFLKNGHENSVVFVLKMLPKIPNLILCTAAVSQIVILQNKSHMSMSMEANFHVLFLKSMLLS